MRSKYLARSITQVGEPESSRTRIYPNLIILTTLFLAAASPQVYAQAKSNAKPPQPGMEETARELQTYTKDGVSVQFSIEPLASEKGKPFQFLAGTEARIVFRILDASEEKTLSNLHPVAWVDHREAGQTTNARQCREKIQSFLQPDFNKRPTIDLNTYLILALNHEPNISVIDPLSGFAGSKLYTLLSLPSSGADWVMSADKKRLYVSMPLVSQVAVIDTITWKLIANVDAGVNPTRVVLQHDGRYLWIGNDAVEEKGSAVTVVDTATLKVVAQLKIGMGHHEIAFTEDDSLAFVTNKQDGTLAVIDVRKLARVTSINVGSQPVALAFSPLSKALYVANEGDGTILVIDGSRLETVARIKAQPGLCSIRLQPSGRFGFVVNRATGSVHIFDVSTNRVVHVVPAGLAADQITFTRQFAYVRSAGTEFVTMIKLADLGKEAAVTRFPAGQKAPIESPANSLADAIVPAPEDGAVLVANPADKMIYFYTEGMAAPMGSLENYRRDPKALLVLDTSLRESPPGVYATTVRLPGAGHYDMAFLLDSPRLVTCFDIAVTENPDLPKPTAVAIKIEPFLNVAPARVGETYSLRFKVSDSDSNQPKLNLEDMGVLIFLSPGIWQQREWAKAVGDGVYEVNFAPPQAGVYYVYFQCPSLSVRFNQLTPLTLQAVKR